MNWLLPSSPKIYGAPREVLLMNAKRDDKELIAERRARLAKAKRRSRARRGRRGW